MGNAHLFLKHGNAARFKTVQCCAVTAGNVTQILFGYVEMPVTTRFFIVANNDIVLKVWNLDKFMSSFNV